MQLGHEPTPYRKKRGKRPPKKSDHKHEYEEVIGILKDFDMPMPSKRCKICGKTEIVHMHYTEKAEKYPRAYRALSLEEVIEKFPNLEVVEVKF